jgi:Ni/Fe-hydrogenase subunit HybB-like protein
MSYVAVLWIEVSPSFLEAWRKGPAGLKRSLGENFLPVIEKALPFVIALGLLLPTMHQSSLGTLMLLSGKKLHALWSTPLLPLLFLISCLAMGYAVVVFESTLSSVAFKRPREGTMLAGLGKAVVPFLWAWAGIRLVDIALRGKLALLGKPDGYVLLFLVEIGLIVAPAVMLASPAKRADAGNLFRAAILMILAGTLYRIDTFIVAFRPGSQYAYFPSLAEILATTGLVAIEILVYVYFVKRFPILTGAAPARAAAASQVR